jgi:hypothetical protein
MFEVLATWSRRRLFWTLVVASFLFLDAVSIWITSFAPGPCIMEGISDGAYPAQNYQCASFHIFLYENAAIYLERIWRMDGATIFAASIGAIAVWQFVTYLTEDWTPLGWFYALDPISKFTLLLVVVGFTTALIFQGQLTIMQGQLDAMEAGQRPWIATTIEPAESLIIGNGGARIKLKYTLENTGHAPAFNVIPIPELAATMTAAPFYFLENNFFMEPLNPIKEVKDACNRYFEHIGDMQERGFTLLFGNTIFPQKTFTTSDIATLKFPEVHGIPPISPYLNPVSPRQYQQNGSLFVISCVDYRVGNGTVHHQTGDVFYLQRESPDDPQKAIDIDLTANTNVIIDKEKLRLIPVAVGTYAN